MTTYSWVTYELKGKLSSLYTPDIYYTTLQQGQANHHKKISLGKGKNRKQVVSLAHGDNEILPGRYCETPTLAIAEVL